jgi:hypothetical protein
MQRFGRLLNFDFAINDFSSLEILAFITTVNISIPNEVSYELRVSTVLYNKFTKLRNSQLEIDINVYT